MLVTNSFQAETSFT